MIDQLPHRRLFWLALCLAITVGMLPLLIVRFSSLTHAEAGCGAAEVEQLSREGRTLAQEEELRAENHSTGLPDCRAYELVTPPFKFGATSFVKHTSVEPGGGSFLFNTLGAPGEAGDSSTPEGPVYLAKREALGWASRSVESSATEFQNPNEEESFADASSSGEEVVAERFPVGAKPVDLRLYVLSSGAKPVEIGPMGDPAKVAAWTQANREHEEEPGTVNYVGASPDLSHVLFESERRQGKDLEFLWPGDGTVVGKSLYEYVGRGHDGEGAGAPALVGVNDEGKQISQCGTQLGAPDVSEEGFPIDSYNAISRAGSLGGPEEGARVFFTAWNGPCNGTAENGEPTTGGGPPVKELFARIDGSSTVAISDPSKADCGECDESEIEAPLSEEQKHMLQGTFQGASSDGSKVFFLSGQKLLPDAQAGAINLYEYNFDPEREGRRSDEKVSLLATDMPSSGGRGGRLPQSGVVRVSEDGSRVFFVSEDDELASNRDAHGKTAMQESEAGRGPNYFYVLNTVTHRYVFIATLAPADSEDWSVIDNRPVEATPDGRFLLFKSGHDLTADASGSGTQIYRYDAQAGEEDAAAEAAGHSAGATPLVRITVGDEGINNNGNAAGYSEIKEPSYGAIGRALSRPVLISDDGSRVFFSSPWAFTRGALNDVCLVGYEFEGVCEEGAPAAENVYEWEGGHVYLLSDGKDRGLQIDSGATQLIGADPSGDNVFFTSDAQLVPADGDSAPDVYDARVDGGFPQPVAPVGCASECQGAGVVPPVFTVPSSATLTGAGNLTPQATAPAAKPKAKPLTRAQKLANALRACRKKRSRTLRISCEEQARAKYGVKAKAKKSNSDRRHGR